MEKINIAELLKDCPKGMELNCTMFDDAKFIRIEENDKPICIRTGDIYRYLTKFGTWTFDENAKCVLFPKGKTTWEGFVPPKTKFKCGDIIACDCSDGNSQLFIFKEYNDNNDTVCYLFLDTDGELDIDEFAWETDRLATEEEKAKLFRAINDNGYKWNAETKTLEKLIEPKFKVGDRIKEGKTIATVVRVCKDFYDIRLDSGIGSFTIDLQDKWELVPNKFDINTLKPFESRVLVRADNYNLWKPALFGFINSGAFYVLGGNAYRQCIPYESNEHLLNTTDDCDEFYKTWKK